MIGSSIGRLGFTIYDLRFRGRGQDRFFDGPVVVSVRMAVAMGREEAATIAPEQWPELFAVGLRQGQASELPGWKEREAPFAVSGRQDFKPWFDFEEEHQPVRL